MLNDLVDYYGVDKLSFITMDGDRAVNNAGIKKIQNMLGIPQNKWPKGFDKRLQSGSGKFVTRLKQYHEIFYPKVGNKVWSEVGLVAESHASLSQELPFDITADIVAWQPGTFHYGTNLEAPSCLRRLTEYAGTVNDLKDLGAYTMRIFRAGGRPDGFNLYGKYMGAGRVFLLPLDGQVVMLNQYGFGGDASKHANILVDAFRVAGIESEYYTTKKSRDNNLYFNGSTSTPIYVVKRIGDKKLSEVAFKPKKKWRAHNCPCCGEIYRYTGRHDSRFCPDCGGQCSNCGKDTVNAFRTWANDTGEWFCNGKCSADLIVNSCGLVTKLDSCHCEECSDG